MKGFTAELLYLTAVVEEVFRTFTYSKSMQVSSVKFTWSIKSKSTYYLLKCSLSDVSAAFIVAFNMSVAFYCWSCLRLKYFTNVINYLLSWVVYVIYMWSCYIRVAAIYRFPHIPWYENWCLVSYPVNLFISGNEFYQCSVIKNINISSLCQLPYISGHNILCNYNKVCVQTLLFWFL